MINNRMRLAQQRLRTMGRVTITSKPRCNSGKSTQSGKRILLKEKHRHLQYTTRSSRSSGSSVSCVCVCVSVWSLLGVHCHFRLALRDSTDYRKGKDGETIVPLQALHWKKKKILSKRWFAQGFPVVRRSIV